ncbi:hypothetical protein KC960_05155 [Candidatus Saccharibacteria bacterium]|nr:hypothetical protein [Candidatus Saccharibacteria bacterium]MCA9346849.1 hypothetical protein [Candidatus Saccharibacteria bacterium]
MTDKENGNKVRQREPKIVWGIILIILGIIFLIQNILQVDVMQYFWPVILIALGIGAIYGRR